MWRSDAAGNSAALRLSGSIVPRRPADPFRFGDLALDESFTDRTQELAELTTDMRNGQNVVVFARAGTASPRSCARGPGLVGAGDRRAVPGGVDRR